MKKIITASTGLFLAATSVNALGIDRSNQNIDILFAEGTTVKFSFASVSPSSSGTLLGSDTGNVTNKYTQTSLGFKTDLNDQFSVALLLDQPYGASIQYPKNVIAGTYAHTKSDAISLIGQYNFGNGFGVHAGLRHQSLSADVFTPISQTAAYKGTFDEDSSTGYLLGVSYERPEIALRVALTYFSDISHDLSTTSTVVSPLGAKNSNSTTTVKAPSAWNLDFQTGVAKDTMVFGSIRHADWAETKLMPAALGGNVNLLNFDSGTRYTIGVGRAFTENLSMALSYAYEGKDNELSTPLSPFDGSRSIQLGASYKFDNLTLSGGYSYTKLGDSGIESGGTKIGSFQDNSVKAFGVSVAYNF